MMDFQNKISTSISEADVNEILAAVSFIHKKIPGLVSLSDLELASLPKPSSDSINFLIENLKMAEQYPELVPEDVDLGELKKDVVLIQAIQKILVPIRSLVKELEDSAILAGSEAYLPSLSIYNSVKSETIRRNREKKRVHV